LDYAKYFAKTQSLSYEGVDYSYRGASNGNSDRDMVKRGGTPRAQINTTGGNPRCCG